MAELAREQFISYREGARLRELLEEGAHQAGFEPNVKFESNESQRIRALVARGLGVAIIPRSDAIAPGPVVAIASLIEPELSRDITLAWRADRRHSPAAAEFLDACARPVRRTSRSVRAIRRDRRMTDDVRRERRAALRQLRYAARAVLTGSGLKTG